MRNTARIIDANLNRAAEGMRVLEDIARFVLEDVALTESMKSTRHELRSIVSTNWTARNSSTDVGTHITTDSENTRTGLIDIAVAASNRVCEALRVIEECFKIDKTESEIEKIRYRMYDTSRDIVQLLQLANCVQWKLCFILTADECVLPWQETLEQSLDAGCDCVQVREKNKSTKQVVDHVKQVLTIATPHEVPVIVNDRVDVMLAAGAHGVHLGQGDLSVPEARQLCNPEHIIGKTVRSVSETNHAIDEGANYVGIGAMFHSPTKPNTPVVGREQLREIIERFPNIPHLAIGGITPNNSLELIDVGCKGFAMSSAIAHSEEPSRVCGACVDRKGALL